MTAQIHDQVQWKGTDYLLVGVEGPPLFEPSDHGLTTRPTTTANWRGWVARYGVIEDRLMLVDLHDVGLRLEPGQSPPTLLGVEAVQESAGSVRFPELRWPLAFTGRLLIATGFIRSLYRHMGFHPAWKFEESWELEFHRGVMTDARDLSEEMRLMREKIQAGDDSDPDDVTEAGWIGRTFRLDFWRSKGR